MTKSFVVIKNDPKIMLSGEDVSQEKNVSVDLPSINFYQYVLVNIPVSTPEVIEGVYSLAMTPIGTFSSQDSTHFLDDEHNVNARQLRSGATFSRSTGRTRKMPTTITLIASHTKIE